MDVFATLSAISPDIRYIAIYQDGDLRMWQRDAISDTSSSESDRYEELLVNPTLLKLAQQRGDIDCGGLDYLLVRYGSFFQLVRTIKRGHVSICIDAAADPIKLEEDLRSIIRELFG